MNHILKKLSTLALSTSFIALSQMESAQAQEIDTQEAYQQALILRNFEETGTFDTPINGGFEISYIDTKDNNQIKTKKDTGAGLMQLYEVENKEYFVILGKRFGESLKWSNGGAVEPTDSTLGDASIRENKEEKFGELPPNDNMELIKKKDGTGVLMVVAGGMKILADTNNDKPRVISEGWGPYYTVGGIQRGYTKAQLYAGVGRMNGNASRHTKLANLFNTFEKISLDVRQQKAQEILNIFNQAQKTEGFVEMLKEAKDALETIAKTGNFDFGSFTGFTFAKKYIHMYSEYSEFIPMPYDDFKRALEEDAQKDKASKEYFPYESDARDVFITAIDRYIAGNK